MKAVSIATENEKTTSAENNSLLSAEERHRVLVEFNRTEQSYPKHALLHQLVEVQVEKTPNDIALRYGDECITYLELNQRANELAGYLHQFNVQPDDRIAICLHRGIDLVVSVLAVIKSGAAYVPLDPAYPSQRLAHIIEDSQPVAIITTEDLKVLFSDSECKSELVCLDSQRFDGSSEQNTSSKQYANLDLAGQSSHQLAYIIYTSGSTGKPKGVAIEHRNAVNFISWAQIEFPSLGHETSFFVTSLNFDLSIFEMFGPLSSGGTVHIVDNALDIAHVRSDSSLINTVPSAVNALLSESAIGSNVHSINMAGEPLKKSTVDAIFESTNVERVCNLYGPSETTTYSTWVSMERKDGFIAHIGRPIANTQVYILDESNNPVAVGEVGEIYIAGDGVARGYLNRDDLTAERFLPNPFDTNGGSRMYRTGDLGRWLEDGNIEYLGRNDFQVKIRGFRIELGEIEQKLTELNEVNDVLVMAREDRPGDQSLVAYLIRTDEQKNSHQELSSAKLKQVLSQQLPDYMVPNAFVWLDEFPLTPNGKIDRASLPAPERNAMLSVNFEAPVGDTQVELAAIWQSLLNVENIGRKDNFFELGGHSLMALQLIAKVRQHFAVNITVKQLFEHPSLELFASEVEQAEASDWVEMTVSKQDDLYDLSWAQKRLWFMNQLDPAAGVAYHMVKALQISGDVSLPVLQHSLDQLLQRHQSYRTSFISIHGEPKQVIDQQILTMPLTHIDMIEALNSVSKEDRKYQLEATAKQQIALPFDLEQAPLIRAVLISISESQHQLLFIQHHIISDGWSLNIMVDDFIEFYSAQVEQREPALPVQAFQYVDYAHWQQQESKVHLAQQLEFWSEHLRNAPALLELPVDYPRPQKQDYQGDSVLFAIDVELAKALREFSHQNSVTLYMTLLAAWSVLLSKLSGQKEVVVGTPVANRQRSEVESIIGFFVNTLALRFDLASSTSISQILEQVKLTTLQAFEHQDLPFDQLVEALNPTRSLSYNPVFQTSFALNNTLKKPSATIPNLELNSIDLAQNTTIFDLSLLLNDDGETLSGGIEFSTSLFKHASIENLMADYKALLCEMMESPDKLISQIELTHSQPANEISDKEREKVLSQFNDTYAEYPRSVAIHQIFEQQVVKTPEAIAVINDDITLSYHQLNQAANKLAHQLIASGVKVEDTVAIGLERGIANIIATLATLKAGAAYVPLEPNYPQDRLTYMLQDAAPVALITSDALMALWPNISAKTLLIDESTILSGQSELANPTVQVSPDNLAYLMYTSGSTGKPKGVMVEHKNVVSLVINNNYAAVSATDCVAHCANPAFDAATWEIWAPLLNGGRCLVLERSTVLDPVALNQALIDGGVTALWLTVGLFNEYAEQLEQAFAKLTWLMVGGDALDPKLIHRALTKPQPPKFLINGYGPTETTTFATTYHIQSIDSDARSIPIGKPLSNTQIYILDSQLNPVTIGEVGEIYIGGDGVARGYLNRPDLTEQAFISNPFVDDAKAKIYKTGDLGKWLDSGVVEYMGRNDFQVKIRGYRIELGEIENQLTACEDVKEAILLVQQTAEVDKRLVAYLVVNHPESFDATAIKEQLLQHLPDFMVPSDFIIVEKFPLTMNGKVDRRALGRMNSIVVHETSQQELSEDEQQLADIWSELLGKQNIRNNDSFFELGGHSLLAARLCSHIQQQFDVDLPLRAIFEAPQLSQMATRIATESSSLLPSELEALLNELEGLDDEQAREQLEQSTFEKSTLETCSAEERATE